MTGYYGDRGSPEFQYDTNLSPFAGLDQATLQGLLTQAQQAYANILMGMQKVQVSYTQGDGSRTITFKPATAAECLNLIMTLRSMINPGIRQRQPIRPSF